MKVQKSLVLFRCGWYNIIGVHILVCVVNNKNALVAVSCIEY